MVQGEIMYVEVLMKSTIQFSFFSYLSRKEGFDNSFLQDLLDRDNVTRNLKQISQSFFIIQKSARWKF